MNKNDIAAFKVETENGVFYIPVNKETNNVRLKPSKDRRCGERRFQYVKSLLASPQMGSCPEGFIRELKLLLDVKPPWEKILENAIMSTVSVPIEKTWSVLDDIFPYPMAGKRNGSKLHTLLVVQDVSSSVTEREEDLTKFISTITTASALFDQILVLFHNTGVIDRKEYDQTNVHTMEEDIRKFRAEGGTSHESVFKQVEAICYDEERYISIIIINTDYESDIDNIKSRFKFYTNYPLCYILNKRYNPTVPPGTIIINLSEY